METPDRVLNFWFEELNENDWFKKDQFLDDKIRANFLGLLERAKAGELFYWRDSANGRLAEIIVLDQFSRNIFRDTPKAFEADLPALILAQQAHALNTAEQLAVKQTPFLYMPYMHSESRFIHEQAQQLFTEMKSLKDHLDYEIAHKNIIDTFGRYPHRNEILGRPTTKEEELFLKQPNSGF